MKKGMITLCIIASFNINSAEVGQGEWYRFTSDFINECVKSVTETKENSNETSGKTVGFVNPPVTLSDCIKNGPYLDSEGQITPIDLGTKKGCSSKIESNYILDVAGHDQKIEILSKNKTEKSIFKCTNGSWSKLSSTTISYEKPKCSSKGIVWSGSEFVLESSFNLEDKKRYEGCYNNLPETSSGRSIKLKSYADLSLGEIKMNCIDGVWEKELDFVSSCGSELCEVSKSQVKVTWSDKEIFAYSQRLIESNSSELNHSESEEESNTSSAGYRTQSSNDSIYDEDKVKELKLMLSSNSIDREEVLELIKNIMTASTSNDSSSNDDKEIDTGSSTGEDTDSSTGGYFDNNPNLKYQPTCFTSSIKSEDIKKARFKSNFISIDGGKSAKASYYEMDRRAFESKEEAIEKSNIIEGEASFNCVKGKWVVDKTTSSCQRKTNFSCEREDVKVNGENKYFYRCGDQY